MARSTRGLVAVLAAAVLLLPAIAPPPARAASFNVNGQIAFLRDGGIWLMQPDGSGQTAVPISEYVFDLALSPDGRRIAWQDGQFVRVANIDGTNVLTLDAFDGGINRGLSWSPDGTRLAYSGYGIGGGGGDVGDLFIAKTDGTGVSVLLPGIDAWGTAWSPDGVLIAFNAAPGGDVFLVAADGSGPPVRLLDGVNWATVRLTWSPDGQRIAYASPATWDEPGEIWAINTDGFNRQFLAAGRDPSWSPDGTRIAYNCGWQICVMAADGSASVQLTSTGQNSFPSWGRAQTPDGTLLSWGNNPPPYGLTDVAAIDVASSNGVALKSDGTVVEWSSDPCSYGLQPPDGLADVIAVSAAGTYSMALKSDGTVVAWGGWPCGQFDPASGTVSVPDGLTGVKAIAAGEGIALALKTDGTVVAWNWGGLVDLSPAFDSDVAAIAAGALRALVLKTDGTVVGWDYGTGEYTTDVSNAVAVAVGDGWDGGGGGQLLALKADGTVVGWGDDGWGKAQPPEGLTGVTAIAAGGTHSLALKSDGTVVGWGLNDYQVVSGPASTQGVTAIAAGGQESIVFIGGSYAYPFEGFFAPVDNDKLNVAKAGAAIPVKFSLGGDRGLDIFATGYPKAVPISCDTGEALDAIETYAAGASGLQYDPVTDRYTYVWKTAKTWKGCYEFQMGLTDGSLHTADFKLR